MADPWQQAPAPWGGRFSDPTAPTGTMRYPLDDMSRFPVTRGVEDIELFLSPFSGIGRMAHVQRELARMRGVRKVRIGGLLKQTANFLVTLEPATSLSILVLANTVVVSATPTRLDLTLRINGSRDRTFGNGFRPPA